MVDISEQLQIIAGDESGEIVRNAVADAAFIIASGATIIDEELYTIRNNRYGWQIRTAIHNALEKLATFQPTPSPGKGALVSSSVLVGHSVLGSLVFTGSHDPSVPFICDSGYYFDSQVECSIDGRLYTKTNDMPAIGMIIHFNANGVWTAPLFISPFESAVTYRTTYGSTSVAGAIYYDGITWHYNQTWYAMPGVHNDSSGHLRTYPETVLQSDGKFSEESILEILQFVHAQAV